MKNNILILSLPRSGSSVLANLVASAGYKNYTSDNSQLLNASKFNKNGYFEDTLLTLLNDQLIRLCYTKNHSFLFTPSIKQFKKISIQNPKEFILDMENVYMPHDYETKIKEYTGCEWDVWGLTRTDKGKKWYKCYSKYGVENGDNILKQLKKTETSFNSKLGIVIKDPRMALVAPLYNFKNFKIIYIRRNKKDVLKSMRAHYGKNLFTKNYLPKTKICSNHFNYKIGYQDFNYYYKNYNEIILDFVSDKTSLIIDYERLTKNKTQQKLNEFINGKVDIKIFQT